MYLPLDFETNLPVPPGPPAPERIKNGQKIDFWVKHNKTGRTEVVDKKWFEENKKKFDLVHIRMTSCRLRKVFKLKVTDEITGKEYFKEYCAYWKKS